MYELPITDAVIGSTIAAPVYSANGTLLVKEGASISAQLLKVLPKFGIKTIKVSEVFKESIDLKIINGRLDNLTYLAIKNLNIDDIMKCANALVSNVLKDEKYPLLTVLYDEDESTAKHSFNTACLVLNTAIQLGWSLDEVNHIAVATLLHDIGKLSIPHNILHKPGKLTEYEYNVVKQHVNYGYEAISVYNNMPTVVKEVILQHHENHDGTGYPRQLSDYNICKQARLVHIADVYEALCAKRSYKPAIPRTVVRKIMLDNSGKMFDPIMLNKFLNVTPLCLLGEELEINGRFGIVISVENKDNPLISTENGTMTLEDFENLTDIIVDEYLYNYSVLFRKGGHVRA